MPKLAEWLRLYDQEQHIAVTYHGMRREALPHLVRHIDTAFAYGVVLYAVLTPETADSVIAEQIAYFKDLGYALEWKLYEHDQPSDIAERLDNHGFAIGEPETVMAFDLADFPSAWEQPAPHIRRLANERDIEDATRILDAIWEENLDDLRAELIQTSREAPDQLSIYAAYEDGIPVSVAWARFPPQNRWVSLWGGSTLSAYRGRGHYRALVAARATEALRRRKRFLTIDASHLSRPILEKLGFVCLTTAYECLYT